MTQSIDYKLLAALSLALVVLSAAIAIYIRTIWRLCVWDDVVGKIENLYGKDGVEDWAAPIVVYEYKNARFNSTHRHAQYRGGYSIGSNIDICVDPKNPSDYIIMDWAGPVFGLLIFGTCEFITIRDIVRLSLGS